MPRPKGKRAERKTKRRRYEAQNIHPNALSPLSEASAYSGVGAGADDDLTAGVERSRGGAPEPLSEVASVATAGGAYTPPDNKVCLSCSLASRGIAAAGPHSPNVMTRS